MNKCWIIVIFSIPVDQKPDFSKPARSPPSRGQCHNHLSTLLYNFVEKPIYIFQKWMGRWEGKLWFVHLLVMYLYKIRTTVHNQQFYINTQKMNKCEYCSIFEKQYFLQKSKTPRKSLPLPRFFVSNIANWIFGLVP